MNERKIGMSFTQEDKQENKYVKEKILREKLTIIRRGVVEFFGAENAFKTIQCLYEVFYHPENIDKIIDELQIKNTEKFPERLSILKSSLVLSPEQIPSKDDFIAKITKAFTSEADFSECIYDGSLEQLENMAMMGPVRIWTAGDTCGFIDEAGEKMPGSMGQIKKIAKAGNVSEIRDRVGKRKYPNSDDFIRYKKEIISVISSEKKARLIPLIGEEFKEKGIEIVVIVEDNLKNLIMAEDNIRKMGFETLPIWIRQGDQKNLIPKESGKEIEYYLEKYNAKDSVTGICEVLNEHNISSELKPGFIVDYDEVFMDAAKKITAQEKAVEGALKRNNWI